MTMDIEVRSARGFVLILGASLLAGVAIAALEQWVVPYVRQAVSKVTG